MNEYLIQYDFTKFQPKWIGDYPRLFGQNNEGVKVKAADAHSALRQFGNQHNYNTFYIKATPC